MARLAENVPANMDLLELIYACLALGFQGRYGVIEGGAAQLEAVRERLAVLLRHERGDTPRALSVNWAPALHRHSALASWLPLWVTCAAVAAILILTYAGLSVSLGNRGDQAESAIRAIRLPVAAAPPPVAADRPRLAPFLAPEIQQQLLAVRDDADRSVVTILGDGLFAPGSIELSATRQDLIRRIAAALTQTPGKVIVAGHSDDRPIRTLRFPSNWDLSQARAQAVARLLLDNGVAQERLRAESRGDSEPLVANDTPAHRALNRRVEITLLVGR